MPARIDRRVEPLDQAGQSADQSAPNTQAALSSIRADSHSKSPAPAQSSVSQSSVSQASVSQASVSQAAPPLETPDISETPASEVQAGSSDPGKPDHEARNLGLLTIHAVLLRLGWIFKTESVMMPAFLDLVSGAGWVRGFLPVLNRVGQNVPPFLLARQIKLLRVKKWMLVACCWGMSVPFFVLAGLAAWGPQSEYSRFLPLAFLVLYTMFFGMTGVMLVTNGTLQGKLIQPARRGRLLALSTLCGTVPAVLAAVLLMPGWLSLPGGSGFALAFLMTASCLTAASLPAMLLAEPADCYHEPSAPIRERLAATWQTVTGDGNFCRFLPVLLLFSVVLILFPHYQALGREVLGLQNANLMLWVVVQNLGTGFGGVVLGPLADRFGQRLALQVVFFTAAAAPATAVVLAFLVPHIGQYCYWLVFFMLGVTPLGLRTLTNYTLEIAPIAEHPRYLGTQGLFLAAPFALSPVVGLAVDQFDFAVVLTGGCCLILLGAALTFRLVEIRHQSTPINPSAN